MSVDYEVDVAQRYSYTAAVMSGSLGQILIDRLVKIPEGVVFSAQEFLRLATDEQNPGSLIARVLAFDCMDISENMTLEEAMKKLTLFQQTTQNLHNPELYSAIPIAELYELKAFYEKLHKLGDDADVAHAQTGKNSKYSSPSIFF